MGVVPRDLLAVGVEPLNADERLWLRRLEDVLRVMPDRLYLLECGDQLFVIDRAASKSVNLHDNKASEAGVVLAIVRHGTMKITGVSG